MKLCRQRNTCEGGRRRTERLVFLSSGYEGRMPALNFLTGLPIHRPTSILPVRRFVFLDWRVPPEPLERGKAATEIWLR
jgi:hypothetical protein